MNAEMTAAVAVDAETNRQHAFPIREFPTQIRWADFAILVLVVGAALFSIIPITGQGKSALVSIKTPDGIFLYPLYENKVITVHGTIGDTVVIIENDTVRVTDSPCRDKLCILAGTLSKPGQWTACLPNGIYVQIINDAQEQEIDAVVK